VLWVAATPLGCDLHFEEPPDIRAWRKGERARLLDARRATPASSHNIASEAIRNALLTHLRPRVIP